MTAADMVHVAILEAARRSYDWLRGHASLASPASPHGFNRALQWLIAVWICEQAFNLGNKSQLSREGARQIMFSLNAHERSRAFDELFSCDTLRVTLAHTIIMQHGFDCESLMAFLSGLATSLPQVSEDAVNDSLLETRLLMALAGFGQMPRLPHLDSLIDSTTLDLLRADETMVHRVTGQIMVASAYGTHELTISTHLKQKLIEVMSVWLLDFAQKYRLDNVALVMRSLGCLVEHPAMHDVVHFLLAQHHPSGHFGFFGPEVGRMKRQSPTWDEVASLQLPVTLACLWALSECSDHSFRLLGSVARSLSQKL